MEDYRIDIMIDKGLSARSIQLELNPFTLKRHHPQWIAYRSLRARFGINSHFEYCDIEVITGIIKRSANLLNVPIEQKAAVEIEVAAEGHAAYCKCIVASCARFCTR